MCVILVLEMEAESQAVCATCLPKRPTAEEALDLVHLPSAFPFKPYFLPVFRAELKTLLWSQVYAGCTLTCCKTQGKAIPLSVCNPCLQMGQRWSSAGTAGWLPAWEMHSSHPHFINLFCSCT